MNNYTYQVENDGKKYKLYPLKVGKRLEGEENFIDKIELKKDLVKHSLGERRSLW